MCSSPTYIIVLRLGNFALAFFSDSVHYTVYCAVCRWNPLIRTNMNWKNLNGQLFPPQEPLFYSWNNMGISLKKTLPSAKIGKGFTETKSTHDETHCCGSKRNIRETKCCSLTPHTSWHLYQAPPLITRRGGVVSGGVAGGLEGYKTSLLREQTHNTCKITSIHILYRDNSSILSSAWYVRHTSANTCMYVPNVAHIMVKTIQ